jgi:MoxR-like ATPase
MAELICIEGPIKGERLDLTEGSAVVLGRGAAADRVIADPVMSSAHAELSAVDGQWTIRDLDSSNGTVVNGNAVTTQALVDGDRIEMGDSVFSYGDGAPQRAPRSAPAEASANAPAKSPAKVPVEASAEDVARVLHMKEKASLIRREVSKTIVGQVEVIDQVLMCLIAGGHGLLIGLPGMAKTLLVSTMAKVLDMGFKRVQFTPDLMPSDITGTEILSTNRETGEKEFRFIKGPIFCNLLLADEINRTPPKTQAALLEAMQEKMVTTGNVTYELPPPFFVLATQNPIEQEGTYPLPEAQLDRFMFNIWVDYPLKDEEHEIVGATTSGGLQEPNCVLTQAEVIDLQRVVRQIPVSDHVISYAIELVRSTRPGNDEAPEVTRKYVSTGAGPRAGQYLVLAGKARAALDGRIHVSCSDIRGAAVPVLRHRILTNFSADSEGMTAMDIVNQLVKDVPEPDEHEYGG